MFHCFFPLTLLLENYRGDGTSMSCCSAQFCILWALKCDPRLLSIWWNFPYMVLRSSSLLMAVAWFVWQWGKVWVRLDTVSTQTRACLEHSVRGKRPIYSTCPPLISWELQWVAPDSSDSSLGWYLEHIGRADTALSKILYLKGNLASLATHHPMEALQWTLLLCSRSAVSTGVSVAKVHSQARTSASWLPGAVNASWAGMWKTVRTALGSCRWTQMSFHISWPHKGLFMIIHPSAFHYLSHRVNPFRTAQLSVQRVNSQNSLVITRQPALTSAHWLWWLLFFPGICIPSIRGNFPHSLSTGHRGCHRNRGGSIWRIYMLFRA